MFEGIEKKLEDIIKIADSCPEKYSIKCFEVLLAYSITDYRASTSFVAEPTNAGTARPDSATVEKTQRGIEEKDLHLKFRAFMKKYSIDLKNMNELFYMEGSDIMPLYDDLKTVRSAEVQIRIALLQAIVNAIKAGSFEFDGEDVRAECQKRKAYDGSNFSANFKNNSSLFDNYKTYKKGEQIKLSDDGKAESAKLIVEIGK